MGGAGWRDPANVLAAGDRFEGRPAYDGWTDTVLVAQWVVNSTARRPSNTINVFGLIVGSLQSGASDDTRAAYCRNELWRRTGSIRAASMAVRSQAGMYVPGYGVPSFQEERRFMFAAGKLVA